MEDRERSGNERESELRKHQAVIAREKQVLRLGVRRILFAFVILMSLLLAGTVSYVVIDGKVTPFQAFYMSVITVSTVGFSEIAGLSTATRPVTILLIFAGFGLFSYLFFAISQLVVEGEIQKIMRRRRLNKEISDLKDHIVICGYGRIGETIANILEKYSLPFVIVERDDARREELVAKNYLFIIGDATVDDVLEEAGIKHASKMITATSSDAQNVFIVLTARELNPDLIIHSRAYAEEAEKRLARAGANKVVFPDNIGGYRLAMGIIRPTFTNFVDVVTRSYEEGEIAVDELEVLEDSRLIGQSLIDAQIRQNYNLIIMAIRNSDGSFHFNPTADTVIQEHDTLIAIGLRRDLSSFENYLNGDNEV